MLVGWSGIDGLDALLLLYGALSTAVLLAVPSLRRHPATWATDITLTLLFVLQSGDWRSPFYLLWLTSLALPAIALPMRRAGWLAGGAALGYLLVAILGGPVPGRLQLVSTETLAIHVSLPFMLVAALAYAAEALRRLAAEQSARERLAIEAERKRIAWELHDSAKQRLHAAHLLVTSLHGRVPAPLDKTVSRAAVELESAASDMDTSLAELRSPLEGRRLDEALRARAAELAPADDPRDRHPRRGTGSAATDRRARLPDRRRGADERAASRRRDSHPDRLRAAPTAACGRHPGRRARPARTSPCGRERSAGDGESRGDDRRAARHRSSGGRPGTLVELDIPLTHNGGTA